MKACIQQARSTGMYFDLDVLSLVQKFKSGEGITNGEYAILNLNIPEITEGESSLDHVSFSLFINVYIVIIDLLCKAMSILIALILI